MQYNNSGLLSRQTYGNGNYIDFTYDNLDRVTEKRYNGNVNNRAVYRYGSDGSLAQTVDYFTGTRTNFTYDLAERLVSQKEYTGTGLNGGTLRSSTDFTYADKTNYLTGVKHYSPLGTQNITYRYGDVSKGEMPDQVYETNWNNTHKLNYTYDALGRLTKTTVGNLTNNYTYVNVPNSTKTTTLVESVSNAAGNYTYSYDELGNIVSISNGEYTTSYEYDSLNQLVRVNDPVTRETHTYDYQNGNILFDHLYDYTEGELPETPKRSEQFFYENSVWGDLLTGTKTVYYNNSGRSATKVQAQSANIDESYALAKRLLGENCQVKQLPESLFIQKSANSISAYSANASVINDKTDIISDEIGNPINIGGTLLEWNGRQLQKISLDENNFVQYFYNADGQRVQKIFDMPDLKFTYTYEYFYNGEILAGQKVTKKILNGPSTEYTLAFMYDNNGDAFGFTYNGTPYYYVKNAQNDVILITDADGQAVVQYQYDAWGKVTQCFDSTKEEIGTINPLLYRSYYLDWEMNMYYLNSRYYFPNFHRFLNADGEISGQAAIQGYNVFAYCFNNPINMSDENGNWPKWAEKAAQLIKSTISTTAAIIKNVVNDVVTSGVAKKVASVVNNAIRKITPDSFMNYGRAAATVGGGVKVISKVPTISAKAVRSVAKNSAPVIGAIIDFGLQVAGGENAFDAGVKSLAHTAISFVSVNFVAAGVCTALGLAVTGPLGIAIGLAVGATGNIIFDCLYDNAKGK